MPKIIISVDFKIETSDIAEAKACFLMEHPMPLDNEGEDLYTFEEWFGTRVRNYAKGEIRQGRKRIAANNTNDIEVE